MKNDNQPHDLVGGVRKVWGSFIDEKDYQHYFVDRLVKDNGFVRRENRHVDQATAMDVGMLIGFLEDTQPKAMASLANNCAGSENFLRWKRKFPT